MVNGMIVTNKRHKLGKRIGDNGVQEYLKKIY